MIDPETRHWWDLAHYYLNDTPSREETDILIKLHQLGHSAAGAAQKVINLRKGRLKDPKPREKIRPALGPTLRKKATPRL